MGWGRGPNARCRSSRSSRTRSREPCGEDAVSTQLTGLNVGRSPLGRHWGEPPLGQAGCVVRLLLVTLSVPSPMRVGQATPACPGPVARRAADTGCAGPVLASRRPGRGRETTGKYRKAWGTVSQPLSNSGFPLNRKDASSMASGAPSGLNPRDSSLNSASPPRTELLRPTPRAVARPQGALRMEDSPHVSWGSHPHPHPWGLTA